MLVLAVGLCKGDNAINTDNIFNCPELNSQEEIDLDKVRASVSTIVFHSFLCCQYRRVDECNSVIVITVHVTRNN